MRASPRSLLVAVLPLLAATAALAGCGTVPPPEPTLPLGSRVELAAGDVWLLLAGGQTAAAAQPRQRLITGALLPERAALEVGAGGRCLVRLGNGTGVFFRGGSRVELQDDGLTLLEGEVWADVPADDSELGRFAAGEVTVSAAGAGFDLLRRDGRVGVYVSRGLAVVAAPGGRVEVESGEEVRVEGKVPPVAKPVSFWEDWTGGMADRQLSVGRGGRGTGRLYGIDPTVPGAPPQELQILSQQVTARIDQGLASTTVEQRFFNPGATPLEGWYWFTVPEDASVVRFAVEVDGVLVDGEMIERRQAAAAYAEAIQRSFDPALLEWVDGRTFRARIHPIPPAGNRRVVLSYLELLPQVGGGYRYVYPMGDGGGNEARVQEFGLSVDLGEQARDYEISTLQEATLDASGRYVSMRRSGFSPRSDFLLELRRRQAPAPLKIERFASGGQEADYVMLRYAPDVDWRQVVQVPGDLVVVLDTSAGGDEADRQLRAGAVEAILRALAAGDHFAVMTADLVPRVVYPEQGLAAATEANIAEAMERLSEVPQAGATDLGEMFPMALARVHDAEQPAVVYVGDGRATVGEISSSTLAERLRRSLAESRARLFTLAVGADADHALLERLARVGGGQALRVELAEQTVQESLRLVGLVKTPTITELTIQAGAGLDQLFSSAAGKVSEGAEVILLGRTHHDLPAAITITGRLGAQPFRRSYPAQVSGGSGQTHIPQLWARQYLTQLMGEGLDDNRGTIIHLGLTYSMMTPLTSFLVLESEAAYQQQGIVRRSRSQRAVDTEQSGSGRVTAEVTGARRSEERAPQAERAASTSAATAPPAAPMPYRGGHPGGAVAGLAKAMPVAPQRQLAPASDDLDGSVMLDSAAADKLAGVAGGPGPLGTSAGEAVAPSAVKDARSEDRPRFRTRSCSDASRRPLAQRRILWQQRLARAPSIAEAVRIFGEAGERCELPRWQDLWALLDLVERRADSGEAVRTLLASFAGQPRLQAYLRKKIVRRTLDPEATLGLYFPSAVNWSAVDQGLAALADPAARLETLRKVRETHPDDQALRSRWVVALLDAGRASEARVEAQRLRRDGLAGPAILQLLCDLEADAGQQDEARRIASELVEYNADDPALRQLLGDLFLRHGWHAAAARQYRTLAELRREEPTSLLRLALATAGMGRVDEALRLERKVAGDDEVAGPLDPRRAARYHSASQLARLFAAARQRGDAEQAASVGRSLKRLGLFDGPGTLELLVWQDLAARLELTVLRGREPLALATRLAAPETGLIALDAGADGAAPDGARITRTLRLQGEPLRRPVALSLITLRWDGKGFAVQEQQGSLPARVTELDLATLGAGSELR